MDDFFGLTSKPVATVSPSLISKPVARVFGLGIKIDNYGLMI
jgi:hypothetical protein